MDTVSKKRSQWDEGEILCLCLGFIGQHNVAPDWSRLVLPPGRTIRGAKTVWARIKVDAEKYKAGGIEALGIPVEAKASGAGKGRKRKRDIVSQAEVGSEDKDEGDGGKKYKVTAGECSAGKEIVLYTGSQIGLKEEESGSEEGI